MLGRQDQACLHEQFSCDQRLGSKLPCLPESNCLAHIYSSPVVCSALLGSLSFGSGVGPGLVGQPGVSFSHELSVQVWMEHPTSEYPVIRSSQKSDKIQGGEQGRDSRFSPSLLLQLWGIHRRGLVS